MASPFLSALGSLANMGGPFALLSPIAQGIKTYNDTELINQFEGDMKTLTDSGMPPLQAFAQTLPKNGYFHTLPQHYLANEAKMFELMRPPQETVQALPRGGMAAVKIDPNTGLASTRDIRPSEPDIHFTENDVFAVDPSKAAGEQVSHVMAIPQKTQFNVINGTMVALDPNTKKWQKLFTIAPQASPASLGEKVALDEWAAKLVAGGNADRLTGELKASALRQFGDLSAPDLKDRASATVLASSRPPQPSATQEQYNMAIQNGSSPAEARDLAAGYVSINQDPGTGNITLTNKRNGESRLVTQQFAASVQPIIDSANAAQPSLRPNMALGTMPLEDIVPATTGVVSKVQRMVAHGPGQFFPGEVAINQTDALQAMEMFTLAAKRAFGQGTRFTQGFMDQVNALIPGGEVMLKPDAAQHQIALLRDFLNTSVQSEMATYNNTALPVKTRQEAATRATDVNNVIKLMGPAPSAAPASNAPLQSSPALPSTAPVPQAAPQQQSGAAPAPVGPAGTPVTIKSTADMLATAREVAKSGAAVTVTVQNPDDPANGKTFTIDGGLAQKLLDYAKQHQQAPQ